MGSGWKVTDRVAQLIKAGMARYIDNVGAPDFDYCPAILWSLGGELRSAGGLRLATIEPEYGLGVIARKDIAEQGFVALRVPQLGVVGFAPNKDDLASDRRVIDYDGENIVVR